MKYLILLGAFQALIVFSIFIINHKKRSSDTILSWLPIWIFIHLGSGFLLHTLFPNAEIHKQYYTFITLIYPPLLYLYAVELSGRHNRNRRKAFYLFIPAIVAAIVYFSIAGYIIAHNGKTPALIIQYNKWIGYLAMVMYPLFGILSIYETRFISNFWHAEKQLVRFIAIVYYSILACFLIIMYNNSLPAAERFISDAHLWGRIFTYSGLLSICLAIGRVKVLSLMHTHVPGLQTEKNIEEVIEQPVTEVAAATEETLPGSSSVRKSILPVDQQSQIAKQLKQWMEEKAVYKDAELTLDKLAETMNLSRHHLSETLNQYLGQSFYQLINEYRIKEVIRLIDESRKNKTNPVILSLAFEAGFHSKSSFNQYFKKVTGDTPSAYMKNKNSTRKSAGTNIKSAFS